MVQASPHRKSRGRLGLAAATLTAGALLGATAAQAAGPTAADFVNAASTSNYWILPAGNYSFNRTTAASQVTAANVSGLTKAWVFQMSDKGPTETNPIVWGGMMYVTSAHDHVYALNATTGKLVWQFADNPHVISFAANRGVGILNGRVYLGTLDGHLIALDAKTGKKLWDVVGVHNPVNSFYTMAPEPYKMANGKWVLLEAASNGDWGGIGYITAFNPANGHRVWEWKTIPGPGQPGHNTWPGDSWKRGGAAPWGGATLDPATQTLYLDLGNPQPDFNGAVRKGANLYSDSMVALDISGATPKLKWYHQFIPNDTHDWDPPMAPVMFTGKVNGKPEQIVAAGDKAGNFWMLDAASGKLVDHTVISFQHGLNSAPSLTGNYACPNTNGGAEFNGGAFDAATNTFFISSVNECGFWRGYKTAVYVAGQFYLAGAFPKFAGPNTGQFNAINVATGVFNWRHHYKLPSIVGALVTPTGLVFSGQLTGEFDAFDTKTGQILWHNNTGSPIIASPIAYTAGGKEYVVIASGTAGNQKVPEFKALDHGAMITAYTLK